MVRDLVRLATTVLYRTSVFSSDGSSLATTRVPGSRYSFRPIPVDELRQCVIHVTVPLDVTTHDDRTSTRNKK